VNAIRTVGHLFDALASSLIFNEEKIQQAQALCIEINLKLAKRIEEPLVNTTSNRNSKERNYVNKHAWGSCNAISSILQFTYKYGNGGCKLSSITALTQIMDCIKFANIINEKIFLSALSTLHRVSREMWLWNNACNPTLGRCLTSCVYQFYKQVRTAFILSQIWV